MTGDKQGWLDPSNEEEAAISHLADNIDLSPRRAKELVARHRPHRAKPLKAAGTTKAEG